MDNRLAGLIPGQQQCLWLVSRGLEAKEVGRSLGISDLTVKNYLSAARTAMDIAQSIDAVRLVDADDYAIGDDPDATDASGTVADRGGSLSRRGQSQIEVLRCRHLSPTLSFVIAGSEYHAHDDHRFYRCLQDDHAPHRCGTGDRSGCSVKCAPASRPGRRTGTAGTSPIAALQALDAAIETFTALFAARGQIARTYGLLLAYTKPEGLTEAFRD